ncbi:hypothetical protein G7Y89_g11577 [Cudoniella acicularis]|uniref:Uncharacterized protein n=1 Tax=Cudoniella acicularis TaxID=354080 RepID=A0A8H4RAN6_9HELO|nr:hypothetical protein G7Y89_g11577 [Cudoniella acicularis]
MYYYAEKLGGLAVSLEHRYFGDSLPFGPAKSWTNAGFEYLNLDNVMADAVSFIDVLKETIPSASDGKAFVASAAGNSSASATWWNLINNVYLERSKEASDKIRKGLAQIQKRLNSNATRLYSVLQRIAARAVH